MVKKLKDVNKDGKINFKDTWLGERLTTKGKLKGPNLAESLKGARRESGETTSTKSTTTPKAKPPVKVETTPTSSPRPKRKPASMEAFSRVGAKSRPVMSTAELRANVEKKKKPVATAKKPNDPKAERPVSPTPYKEPAAIIRAQTARLGNITEAEWDKMTREERRAKGLPESWVDWIKAGGKATVKPAKPKRPGYSSQTYAKGGMTKGKK